MKEDRKNLRNMLDGCIGLSIISKFGFDWVIFCHPSATQNKPKKSKVVSGVILRYWV